MDDNDKISSIINAAKEKLGSDKFSHVEYNEEEGKIFIYVDAFQKRYVEEICEVFEDIQSDEDSRIGFNVIFDDKEWYDGWYDDGWYEFHDEFDMEI